MSKFKYYNRNPDELKIQDCVCRAISTATGLKYEAVSNLLTLSADEYSCERLCVCCYNYLLENILCYKRHNANGKTVKELANKYNKCNLLIRIDSHLTCVVKGVILDIWDCSNCKADFYWLIK